MQRCWCIKCMCSTSDHNIWKYTTHVLKQIYSISNTAILLGKTQICVHDFINSPTYTVWNTYSTVNNLTYYTSKHGPGSVVGIATAYGLDSLGIEAR